MDEDQTLSDYAAGEIRATLARRRITGRDLAAKLDVSRSWISYRLTGATEIGLNDLQRIAAALDVEITELLPVPARRGQPPAGPIRTAYPDSSERPAPHAPDVRSRPVPAGRSSDAGSRTKRAFWTHA